MIRVDMCRDNCFNAKPMAFRKFNILSDLELRIDDRGAALTTSTQQI
jgi:hypothetical protein